MFILGTNSKNRLGSLPTHLGLSSRTSDFALKHPAQANQPLSSSLNVMGPNPLFYPPNFIVDMENEPQRLLESDRAMDERMQVDVPILTSVPHTCNEASTSQLTSSCSTSSSLNSASQQSSSCSSQISVPSTVVQPSTSKQTRNYPGLESLLAVVNIETASGELSLVIKFVLEFKKKYFYSIIFLLLISANEDRPQDLSCNKDSSSSLVNYSQDHDYNSDSDVSHIRGGISPSLINAAALDQGLPTSSRPQIIVSPRKQPGESGLGTTNGLSMPSLTIPFDSGQEFGSNSFSLSSSSSSRSPNKSVIVRAGSSLVSFCLFTFIYWKFIRIHVPVLTCISLYFQEKNCFLMTTIHRVIDCGQIRSKHYQYFSLLNI